LQYFVTSDDAVIANQINKVLVQLRQPCPASNMLPLDAAASTLEAASKGASPGARDSGDILLIVLAPDFERALGVLRDVHRRTTARILAVGPATDTKLVLRALREGALEYLDQGELLTELSDALNRLNASGTMGRIIGVLAPGGGSGASTLAVNMATVLTQKYQSCALIDLKLEAGDLAPLLNLKPNHTLSDLCQNIERVDYSLLQGCLSRSEGGVQLLAAPARIADVATVTADAVVAILSLASRNFPFVVVDIDHTYRPEQRRAMLLSDVLVLVLRLDFTSLRNMRITLDFLKSIDVSRDRIRIVANQVGQPGQLSAAQAEESLGIKIGHLIPDDQKTVNRANNDGIPVVVQSPSAKVSRSLTELASSLAGPAKPGV
jgi:pilus assembly protein CpaE